MSNRRNKNRKIKRADNRNQIPGKVTPIASEDEQVHSPAHLAKLVEKYHAPKPEPVGPLPELPPAPKLSQQEMQDHWSKQGGVYHD